MVTIILVESVFTDSYRFSTWWIDFLMFLNFKRLVDTRILECKIRNPFSLSINITKSISMTAHFIIFLTLSFEFLIQQSTNQTILTVHLNVNGSLMVSMFGSCSTKLEPPSTGVVLFPYAQPKKPIWSLGIFAPWNSFRQRRKEVTQVGQLEVFWCFTFMAEELPQQ